MAHKKVVGWPRWGLMESFYVKNDPIFKGVCLRQEQPNLQRCLFTSRTAQCSKAWTRQYFCSSFEEGQQLEKYVLDHSHHVCHGYAVRLLLSIAKQSPNSAFPRQRFMPTFDRSSRLFDIFVSSKEAIPLCSKLGEQEHATKVKLKISDL